MQLKTNKSAGPDKLMNNFFIYGREYLLSTLHTLFNKLFELGYSPETWSEGYIIPLHKKGSLHHENILICLYNFYPLKPHFLYSKTGGLQGYTLFFLFLLKI